MIPETHMTAAQILKPYIEMAEASAVPKKGDYLKDGLIYCGKCHTEKQVSIDVGDAQRIVPCLCDCETAERDREFAADAERKRLAEINAMRINGIQDTSIRHMTFDKDDGKAPDMTDKARRYVDSWAQMYRDNIGLLLWGNTGNGKTYTAACIANALIDSGVPVMMTSFAKLLNAITGMFAEDRAEYIDSLACFKLLIIDDLGAERDTSFSKEQVYNIIDTRYKQKKPVIITTNMTLSELQKPKDMDCQRIYDRVLEMCVPIHFTGDSRRKGLAADKMKLAKAMFE